MSNQAVLGPRAILAIRFYVGGGWVVGGILTIVGNPSPGYQTTDQRSNPLFWVLLGLVVFVGGIVMLGYAVRDLRRLRGNRGPTG